MIEGSDLMKIESMANELAAEAFATINQYKEPTL